MRTIADEIREWAAKNVQGATVMTQNTDAYNHMQKAVADLLERPWACLALQKDMPPSPPQWKVGDDATT